MTGEIYSCTFADCGRAFSKGYELKKHKALHENPGSVFHCPECDFITLQKRSLAIHVAIHTGEKDHECPDYLVGPSGLPTQRCDYRTNDPAALSKHRKKIHGYVPPANRTRAPRNTPAAPRKPRENKDENVSRRRQRPQRSASASRRKPSRVPRTTKNPTTSVPLIRLENVDGDAMDVDVPGDSGNDTYGATWVEFDDEMRLDTLYDPSLRAGWMAMYEEGYSSFDTTGMKYLPESLCAVSSSAPVDVGMQTGREGCLCPEWMVEAGIEGWDASDVADAHAV